MFRIRRIYDDILPVNKEALKQVKEIMHTHFDAVPEEEIESIGERLRNPFKQQFRSILFAAENMRRKVLGFALLLHEPSLEFCFLDWIAITGARLGGGVGGALYEQIRQEASALGAMALFFECLPDNFEHCAQEDLLKENRARLRFYERYGARPIVNTEYESPVKPDEDCVPHLVCDGLDHPAPPPVESLPGKRFVLCWRGNTQTTAPLDMSTGWWLLLRMIRLGYGHFDTSNPR